MTVVHFSLLDSSELMGQRERKPQPRPIRLDCLFCRLMLYEHDKFPQTFRGLQIGTLKLRSWSEGSTLQHLTGDGAEDRTLNSCPGFSCLFVKPKTRSASFLLQTLSLSSRQTAGRACFLLQRSLRPDAWSRIPALVLACQSLGSRAIECCGCVYTRGLLRGPTRIKT